MNFAHATAAAKACEEACYAPCKQVGDCDEDKDNYCKVQTCLVKCGVEVQKVRAICPTKHGCGIWAGVSAAELQCQIDQAEALAACYAGASVGPKTVCQHCGELQPPSCDQKQPWRAVMEEAFGHW